MKKFTLDKAKVLGENLYCSECGTWVYCPEMNTQYKNEQGETVLEIGEGCLLEDNQGKFLQCPGCNSRFYLEGKCSEK